MQGLRPLTPLTLSPRRPDEPRRILNLEIDRGLCLQVENFKSNRHSADEKRTTPKIGGIHSPNVWVLNTEPQCRRQQKDRGGSACDRNPYTRLTEPVLNSIRSATIQSRGMDRCSWSLGLGLGTGWGVLPYSFLSIKPRNSVLWGGSGGNRRLY